MLSSNLTGPTWLKATSKLNSREIQLIKSLRFRWKLQKCWELKNKNIKPHNRNLTTLSALVPLLEMFRRRTGCRCWRRTESTRGSRPNSACWRSSSASKIPPNPSRPLPQISAIPAHISCHHCSDATPRTSSLSSRLESLTKTAANSPTHNKWPPVGTLQPHHGEIKSALTAFIKK